MPNAVAGEVVEEVAGVPAGVGVASIWTDRELRQLVAVVAAVVVAAVVVVVRACVLVCACLIAFSEGSVQVEVEAAVEVDLLTKRVGVVHGEVGGDGGMVWG